MRLPGYLIAFILGLLLATTTPVGTGAGLHQFDLLHPLFSHVHLVNGRIVTHEQLAWESSAQPVRVSVGVSLGSEPGGNTTNGGPGVSPTVPTTDLFVGGLLPGERISIEPDPLHGHAGAPPDPPPL